jgi:hypothetical protein
MRAACLIIGVAGSLLYLFQLYVLRKAYKQEIVHATVSPPLQRALEFRFFVGLINFFFLIQAVDLRGFAGIYHPALWHILNEIVSASILCCCLVLVDYWIVCAAPLGRNRVGVPYRRRAALLVYILVLGCGIVSVAVPSVFFILDGIKAMFSAIFGIAWLVMAAKPIMNIRKTLHAQVGDVLNSAQNSPATVSDDSVTIRRRQALKLLDRKFAVFYIMLFVAAVLLAVVSFTSFTSKDPITGYFWKLPCDIGVFFILIKIVQMISCILALIFFSVPRSKKSSSNPAVADVRNADKPEKVGKVSSNTLDHIPDSPRVKGSSNDKQGMVAYVTPAQDVVVSVSAEHASDQQ